MIQPDWGTNMQIVDAINADPKLAYPVLKALEKRLASSKHSVGICAIELLSSLVKNVPPIVPLVASQPFLDFLVKTLPKQVRDPHHKSLFSSLSNPTRDIQAVERFDRLLLAIESWAKAFSRNSPLHLPAFEETYRNLQRAGVKFPQPTEDETAPVVTPKKSVTRGTSSASSAAAQAALARHEQRSGGHEHHKHRHSHAAPASMSSSSSSMPASAAATPAVAAAPAPSFFVFQDPECRAASESSQLLLDMIAEAPDVSPQTLQGDEVMQTIYQQLKPLTQKLGQNLQQLAQVPPTPSNAALLAEYLQANEIAVDACTYFEGLIQGKMTKRPAPSRPTPAPEAAPPSVHAAASPASSPSTAVPRKAGIPLLQPPPDAVSATSTPGSRHRTARSAHKSSPHMQAQQPKPSPAPSPATSPASSSLIDLDLLFSSSGGTPAQRQQSQQQPTAASAISAQPASAVDFFSAIPAPPATSSTHTPAHAPAHAPAPAPLTGTPFDDDGGAGESDDPFLALATRTSPPAAGASGAGGGSQRPRTTTLEDFENLRF